MPKVLTVAATVVCTHQGKVQLMPSQQALLVGGNAALVMGDLDGKPIVGCTQAPSPSTAPCTATVSMLVGAAMKLTAAGKPVLLDTAQGMTNGVPPGQFRVQAPGQTKLDAS